MFHAELLSLSDGQSYQDVKLFEDTDIDASSIPRIFEDWTACFIDNDDLIIAHHWKIKVIKISNSPILPGPGSIFADRLILDGDISYPDVNLIASDQFSKKGIPRFFIKRNGIAGQMAFVNYQGVFITHDTNVSSIIIKRSVTGGVTNGELISNSAKRISKQNTKPQTIHGKIN